MALVFVAAFAIASIFTDDIIIYGALMYFCGAFVMLALVLTFFTMIDESSDAQ